MVRRPGRRCLEPRSVALFLCVAVACQLPLSFAGLVRRVSGTGECAGSVSVRATKETGTGGTPVVDDSDFSNDESKESKEGAKKANFDDILTEADNFATSIERKSRRSTAVARVSLEDELRGLSLEDDTDLDMMMMSRARGGKARETSLTYRINKWFEETKEMVTNPTRIQVTYGMIFFSCFSSLIIMGVITFALGAVRLQGDGVETAMRQKIKDGDAFMQRYQQIRENKRRFAEMDDIRKYTSDLYTLNPDSKINYTPKTMAEITPEDVIGEY